MGLAGALPATPTNVGGGMHQGGSLTPKPLTPAARPGNAKLVEIEDVKLAGAREFIPARTGRGYGNGGPDPEHGAGSQAGKSGLR